MEITGVSCTLSGRRVFTDFSLSLSERRIGIVGRNGSGKSTLARLITGLIPPDRGTVKVNGCDVAHDRQGALRTVGILFQNPDHQIIFPTVDEELAFGLTQLGASRQEARYEAAAMLARFGHADWASRPVAELSQGHRHLVCLMAVLAMRPAVLLLDEPFSGLDIPTTRLLRCHLDEAEPAIIQITHDPSALDHYDRVVWIDQGLILADGSPDRTLRAYMSAVTGEEARRCSL